MPAPPEKQRKLESSTRTGIQEESVQGNTLRGMTMGGVKISTKKGLITLPCVLASKGFPSWLLVLQELKLSPVLVLLSTRRYVAVVQALVPHSCRIIVGQPADAPSIGWHTLGSKPIGLVDGGFKHLLSDWFGSLGMRRVYDTCQQRRAIDGWHNTSISLRHATLGGVTTGRARISAAFRDITPKPSPIPQIAPRDASTMLSAKGASYHYRQAPSERHTQNFACVNVGTPEKPVYHGGGWLPAPLTKATRVLTPIFMPPSIHGQIEPSRVMNFWSVTTHRMSWSLRYRAIIMSWIQTFLLD
jgi:hypothetical protein